MTYHPDSVLVEKVAKAIWVENGKPVPEDCAFADAWEDYREDAVAALRVACPLVAGVIADRLDEETGGDSKDRWAAEFVRSEFVDGEA